MIRMLAALTFSLAVGSTAHAQLSGLTHVLTVPGVMNNIAGPATLIPCTNGGSSSGTIGVDLYDQTGTYVVSGSISVVPNRTVTFGTSVVANQTIDVNLGVGLITRGHMRILASPSKGIICSAFLVDAGTGTPQAALAVVKKFTQK